MELSEDVVLTTAGTDGAVSVRAGSTVRVVHDRSDSAVVDVLLPGHGVYPVDRRKFRSESPHASLSYVSSLVLRIDADTEDFNGILSLLKLVGKHLKQCKIIHDETSDVVLYPIKLCEVLRECPNAEAVELIGLHVTDISQLSGFVETHDCRFSVLEFDKFRLDSDDDLENFFEALSNDSTRMSQQLLQLCVEISDAVVSSTTLAAMQKMLLANRTLEVFMLGVSQNHMDMFKQGLYQLPPVYLPTPYKSFPLRAKLAFISVVHAEANESCAISRLDSGVISTVFEFAAPSPKRFIQVYAAAEPFHTEMH
ncbi:hypothetical protein Poli38472_011209 [Pythium oligandrum]|uniref:Uncharacterized protein n=1 Tax=Pythium oligandrum TaxID=41045 RepID=A0A8K1FNQ9_PYTOL|nr:hypothetical protein Poli38472_011209 [Pythium oligandrum]|eukprot:TMW67589.1 hypothetical protein Poli38472_011209 [Pythium oligandrum]